MKKIYPSSARKRGQEGIVRVSLTLDGNGVLLDTQILEESKFSLLNDATLRAVKKASPFPPLPQGMDHLEISFTMAYELE